MPTLLLFRTPKACTSIHVRCLLHTRSSTSYPYTPSPCSPLAFSLFYLPVLVFGIKSLLLTEPERQLSSQFIDFWTSFARDGVPSSAQSAVTWPAYSYSSSGSGGDQNIDLDIPLGVSTALKSATCDVWDNLYP
jgi:hypothetical protein